MKTAVATNPVNLLDLPGEILDGILNPTLVGKSTVCASLLVCKRMAGRVINVAPPVLLDSICKYAARDGHLGILEYALDVGFKLHDPEAAHFAAASAGHLHIIEHHIGIGHPWPAGAAEAATAAGHLHIFEYVREHRLAYKRAALTAAASAGQLHIVEYIYTNGIPICDSNQSGSTQSFISGLQLLLQCASKYGHINVISWIMQRIPSVYYPRIHANNAAIGNGQIGVLEWLVQHGSRPSHIWYKKAVEHQQIGVLEWLFINGYPGIDAAIARAQLNDNAVVLEWLASKGL